jgi:sulfonate transport system substrate-binding protein
LNTLTIGGVPEHFNLPWQQAIIQDAFSGAGVDVAWAYYAGGTGALTQALSSGDLDVAILLTEGFLSAASSGLDAQIVKVYIDTPLVWGIYTADPNVHSAGDPGKTYAISRYGSGSHLMPMIHAEQRGQKIAHDCFSVVNSLDGAIRSLLDLKTHYFYWEKFMTKPYVDSGKVRLVGEFSAPWSGFLVVASSNALRRKSWPIRTVLDIMNARCNTFISNPSTVDLLIRNFHMTPSEARQWLHDTHWNDNYSIPLDHLTRTRDALAGVGKCDPQINLKNCCAEWIVLSES